MFLGDHVTVCHKPFGPVFVLPCMTWSLWLNKKQFGHTQHTIYYWFLRFMTEIISFLELPVFFGGEGGGVLSLRGRFGTLELVRSGGGAEVASSPPSFPGLDPLVSAFLLLPESVVELPFVPLYLMALSLAVSTFALTCLKTKYRAINQWPHKLNCSTCMRKLTLPSCELVAKPKIQYGGSPARFPCLTFFNFSLPRQRWRDYLFHTDIYLNSLVIMEIKLE